MPNADIGTQQPHRNLRQICRTFLVSKMGTRKVEMGDAGHAVAANIHRIRELVGMTLQDVSDRLTQLGRPIARSGLSKIEAAHRRVDVDDLVAIARALGVTADRLLRTADGRDISVYGTNRDDYEDTVAAAGVLLRKVLGQMPANEREEFESYRRRTDARQWLDQETTKQQTGSWIAPRAAKISVEEWCSRWLAGYGTRKPSTVRMAEVHIAKIVAACGPRRLDSLRPSNIKSWLVQLQTGHADSYVYALHARLAQVLADAVHDGVLARSPCSRRTAPRTGSQRPYVATTDQIWALHDGMGERYRAGLLLAAFAGLRAG